MKTFDEFHAILILYLAKSISAEIHNVRTIKVRAIWSNTIILDINVEDHKGEKKCVPAISLSNNTREVFRCQDEESTTLRREGSINFNIWYLWGSLGDHYRRSGLSGRGMQGLD